MDLSQAGIVASAASDLERNAVLWQQILDRSPRFQSDMLAIQLQRLHTTLHLLRVQHLRERARKIWSQATGTLQTLLALEPGEHEAKAWLAPAKLHLRHAWMYENAVQFVAEQVFDTARVQRQMLWQEDPYDGEPAHLSQQVGLDIPRLPHSEVCISRSSAVRKAKKAGAPTNYKKRH